MNPFIRWTIFIIAVLLWDPLTGMASLHRTDLDRSSPKINADLLKYAQEERYDEVLDVLPLMQPIADAIFTDYGTEVLAEVQVSIDKGDSQEILRSILKLIYFDMRNLFDSIQNLGKDSPQKSKDLLKMAFANYLLLSPYMKEANLKNDQEVKNLFRAAMANYHQQSRFSRSQEISTALEQKLLKLFAEISQSISETLSISGQGT